MGDWNQPYQNALTAYQFAPALTECTDPPADIPCPGLDTVEYEDHQPPLYYLLQAPVYALTDGDLIAMRLWSALIGAGVVLAAWAALRMLFPHRPYLALTGAGFIAFLPQHLAIMGSVSNDALAELIAALTLLAVIVYLRGGPLRGFTSPPAPLSTRGEGEPVRPDSDVHSQTVSPVLLGILVGSGADHQDDDLFPGRGRDPGGAAAGAAGGLALAADRAGRGGCADPRAADWRDLVGAQYQRLRRSRLYGAVAA